jgi:hypothetical protein
MLVTTPTTANPRIAASFSGLVYQWSTTMVTTSIRLSLLADPGYTKENEFGTSVSGVLRVRALALEGVLPRFGVNVREKVYAATGA